MKKESWDQIINDFDKLTDEEFIQFVEDCEKTEDIPLNVSSHNDIYDKVLDYIDNMSDEKFVSLVKDCEENPEFNFAISNIW